MAKKLSKYHFVLLFLFVIAVFLRLYKIDQIPLGLHIDEVGMAYDAWCLSQTGTDRWLNSWPIYLNNTGNGQSVLYCWLCSFLFRIFEVSFLQIRLPAIVFSLLTLFFGLKFVKLCWTDYSERLLLVAVLFVLVPYFTQNSRYGLDCNLMLGMSTIFFYFFAKAIYTSRSSLYFFSGILAGLVLYSYIISYLILPAFFLIALPYLIYTKKISLKQIILFGLPLGILAAPLILVQIVNIFQLDNFRLGIFTINKLDNYRTSEFTTNAILSNFYMTIKSMLKDGELIFDAFPQYGTFYIISIPFIAIGAISCLFKSVLSLKSRNFSIYFLLAAWVAVFVLLGCFLGGDGPLTYRFNAVFFVLLLLLVEGILKVTNLLKRMRIRRIFRTALLTSYVVFFCFFIRYYFWDYPLEVYPQYGFLPALFDVVEYNQVHSTQFENSQIYLCLDHSAPEYYGLAARVQPQDYYENGQRLENGYHNVTFITHDTTKIDEKGYYIVWEVYDQFIEKLKDSGFTVKETVGHYVYLHK